MPFEVLTIKIANAMFSEMSNNYDPSRGTDDEFINQKNSELYDSLIKELKNRTTGRWQYDKIDYCWTGKNANCDTYGYQGLRIDDINDEKVLATVHTGKSVGPGETLPEAQREILTEIVCGFPFPGEWEGDSWFLTFETPIAVETILDEETGKLNAVVTANALYEAAQKALVDWDRECKVMDECIDALYNEKEESSD